MPCDPSVTWYLAALWLVESCHVMSILRSDWLGAKPTRYTTEKWWRKTHWFTSGLHVKFSVYSNDMHYSGKNGKWNVGVPYYVTALTGSRILKLSRMHIMTSLPLPTTGTACFGLLIHKRNNRVIDVRKIWIFWRNPSYPMDILIPEQSQPPTHSAHGMTWKTIQSYVCDIDFSSDIKLEKFPQLSSYLSFRSTVHFSNFLLSLY